MSGNLFNWTFQDADKFLKAHGFYFHHTRGSHYFYYGFVKSILRQVCVPFHGQKAIKPKTMKSIIAQSGIDKEEWFK